MEKFIQQLKDLEWGLQMDWKFGLITYSIVKRKSGLLEINDCSGTWISAVISIETMEQILKGEASLLDLDWK